MPNTRGRSCSAHQDVQASQLLSVTQENQSRVEAATWPGLKQRSVLKVLNLGAFLMGKHAAPWITLILTRERVHQLDFQFMMTCDGTAVPVLLGYTPPCTVLCTDFQSWQTVPAYSRYNTYYSAVSVTLGHLNEAESKQIFWTFDVVAVELQENTSGH